MNVPIATPRGLYLVTPDEPDTGRLLARVAPLLVHGVTWLQYRNKNAGAALRHEQAAALLPLCRAGGVPLIVNDDWRIAAAIGADGVHVGEHDGELSEARAALGPDAIVGASCYDQLDRARRAADAGASYVAFGAFHPSTTKPGARHASPALLGAAADLHLPRVAIGGLTPDNVGPIVAAGADLIAVISGVFSAPDPPMAVRAYRRAIESALAEAHE